MSKQMNNLINKYLEAHSLAWAPTTLKSERARLNNVCDLIAAGPGNLYQLKSLELGAYSLKTLFIRLADFETWANRHWGYKKFTTEQARLFKHVYTRERINVSIGQFTTSISGIEDQYLRTLASGLFQNGLRISELTSYDKGTGLVRGKGGKLRRLLKPDALPDLLPSSGQLRRLREELSRTNLKPHTLRKGAATLLARAGMQSQDLLHVMGWSSLETAASYLQPMQDDVLSKFANNVLGGSCICIMVFLSKRAAGTAYYL